MWEARRIPTSGNFFLRQIAMTFLAVVISALFIVVLHSPAAHAADATWQGDNITLGSETFAPESGKVTGPPSGAQIYSLKNGASAKVLYIPSGADMTKETQATLLDCTVAADNSVNCPTSGRTISLEAKPEATKKKTQCDVPGVGWIVCMVSRFIAGGMDNIFGIISGYLEVKTITGDTKGGLYQAWDVAKNLANMAFVVAFLVIIYSQITSVGFSNYNIKKMLPRLIIAAIAVNISYYICAICVDLSNILGHNIQKALIDIRTSLPDPGAESMDWSSWKNITEYVLSGGTVVAAGFAAKAAFLGGAAGGSISGLTFLLFPILVSGALAVLVAVLMLAARQALITVLIVIAPFAFVAYLLPNTEKWFDKWRELFTTMLMLFPMFSLVFGGSQLASYIIINNADRISVIIFAMFIQVAPLAITPMLVKFSGSLVGRIAGIVDNPKKGLIDNARNWATDKAEVQRAKGQIAAQRGGGTRYQRQAYRRELDKKNREGWKKAGEAHIDAGWHQDKRYQRHHSSISTAELIQKQGESKAELHFERQKSQDPNLQRYIGSQRLNEDRIKNLQAKEDAAWEEAKSEAVAANNQFIRYAAEAQKNVQQSQVTAYRTGTAQAMQKIEYALAVSDPHNDALAREAGGIDIETGADSARASALAAIKKSKLEAIAEGRELAQRFNLTATQRQELARGGSVTGKDNDGNTRTFDGNSKYVRLSAIEDQVSHGTVEEALEIIMQTGKGRELYDYRDVITDAMIKGGLPQKANFLGGKTLDDVRAGRLETTSDLLRAAATAMAKGKLSAEQLLNQDKTSMEVIVQAVRQVASGQITLDGEHAQALPTELERLFASAETAMTDPRINVRLGERAAGMKDLVDIGRGGTAYTAPTGGGTPPPPPPPPASGPTV